MMIIITPKGKKLLRRCGRDVAVVAGSAVHSSGGPAVAREARLGAH